jgi:hypothetical protein
MDKHEADRIYVQLDRIEHKLDRFSERVGIVEEKVHTVQGIIKLSIVTAIAAIAFMAKYIWTVLVK